MATETRATKYISLFHSRDHAAEALKALEAAKVPRADTTVIAQSKTEHGNGYAYNAADDLATMGVPARDLKHLQDGIRDGGTVIVVEGVVEQQSTIEKIFAKYSANKIDETEVPVTNTNITPDEDRIIAAPVAAATVPAVTTAAATTTEAGFIPVIEEGLLVGKREVETGGVRVFSHMVEEPAMAEVTLREEHAVIERRPVNRAVTDADFQTGKVIELTETAEEAVVGKVARVVEEVYVGKVATEHTETIHDTVRHTEVDVQPVVATTTTERKTY